MIEINISQEKEQTPEQQLNIQGQSQQESESARPLNEKIGSVKAEEIAGKTNDEHNNVKRLALTQANTALNEEDLVVQ